MKAAEDRADKERKLRIESQDKTDSYAKALSEVEERLSTQAEKLAKAAARIESEREVHGETKANKKQKAETWNQREGQEPPEEEQLHAGRREAIKIVDVSRQLTRCECCQRNYPSNGQLVRIASGQMLCPECLGELKSALP